jgi:membrane-bound ClpP family serine protease
MVAVLQNHDRPAPSPWGRALLLAGLLGVLQARPVAAQVPKPAGTDGMFITVPNPITESAVDQIKTKVRLAFERQGRQVGTIVFDFNPTGRAGTSEDGYGACITLKNYITGLGLGEIEVAGGRVKVNTNAYVHDEVCKFTILPVLACHGILMSPDASMGDILRDYKGTLPPEVKLACQTLAGPRTNRWGDLILRMLDRQLPIQKATFGGAKIFCSQETLDRMRNQKELVVPVLEQPAELETGNTMFSAGFAFKNDLAREVPPSRLAVADILGLPRTSVREDWLAGRTAVAFRVEVNGTIDSGRLESLKRRLNAALRQGANLIILQLSAEGGQTVDVASYARFVKELAGAGGPVKTIAYIPRGRSLGAATFLALGCSEIVMGDNAALGDFEYLRNKGEEDLKPLRKTLEELAEDQAYPALLFRATLQKDLILYQAQSAQPSGAFQVITDKELEQDEARPKGQRLWAHASRIPVRQGEMLKVTATLAKQLGVALNRDYDAATVEEVYRHYDLDPERVTVSRDDWMDRVAEFFRAPIVNVLLIMIGIAGLILEFKMPGLGFPAVIAGVCFVLFFWAHSFVGQFTMLAVLLFVLGLILIGLEVFVMPGIGVTGISGVVLLVASLVLVTLQKMPESTADWVSLGTTLTTFVVGILAAVAVALTLAWYLPHIPYANRLILSAPTDDEGAVGGATVFGTQAPAALLGAIGEAATALRPAGKARFGEDFLDVVSQGDYINPGSRVQVIEIEGNRIVVKEV